MKTKGIYDIEKIDKKGNFMGKLKSNLSFNEAQKIVFNTKEIKNVNCLIIIKYKFIHNKGLYFSIVDKRYL